MELIPLKKLSHALLAILALGGLLVLVAFVLPSGWEVQREVQVHAGVTRCAEYARGLESWAEWSPWGSAADGAVTTAVEEQVLGFDGPVVGVGTLTLLAPERPEEVAFEVVQRQGRELVRGTLRFEDLSGSSTRVIWSLRGEAGSDLFGSYVSLWRAYTTGPEVVLALARLKRRIEAGD